MRIRVVCGEDFDWAFVLQTYARGQVKRSGGIVSLSPVVDALNKVGVGVDKTAAELAIVRIKREVVELEIEKSNFNVSSG